MNDEKKREIAIQFISEELAAARISKRTLKKVAEKRRENKDLTLRETIISAAILFLEEKNIDIEELRIHG